nr:MAG TPA: portal protein [Herelleviridae sp.]
MTVNEARKELGLTGKVPGGDTPVNGVVVQRIGQLLQEEQYQDSQKKERLEMMQQILQPQPQEEDNQDTINGEVGMTPQDKQQGFDGTGRNVNGKPKSNTGKDGQQKDQENTNSQGVKDSYKEKPEDFKK